MRRLAFRFHIGFAALLMLFVSYAVKADSGKGVGPIQELKLEDLNLALAKSGKATFTAKCSACHKMAEKYVGPSLGDVFKRRRPEWIMNMILNPAEMTQKDPAAQELLAEFLTQMTFQNISQDEARSILEYFRHYSEKGEIEDQAVKSKSAPQKEKKVRK